MGCTDAEDGMKLRRRVLGDAYVDASAARAGADPFTAPLHEAVTELGWGYSWRRDGIDLKTRSLVTVAMLIALNRPHEMKLHMHGALNNGATEEELREVLLHAGVYCGWPSAVDAFRNADAVRKERALTA